jgi:hypothetical protein
MKVASCDSQWLIDPSRKFIARKIRLLLYNLDLFYLQGVKFSGFLLTNSFNIFGPLPEVLFPTMMNGKMAWPL